MATAGIPTPTPPPPDGGGLVAHELMVMVVVARGTWHQWHLLCSLGVVGGNGGKQRVAKGRRQVVWAPMTWAPPIGGRRHIFVKCDVASLTQFPPASTHQHHTHNQHMIPYDKHYPFHTPLHLHHHHPPWRPHLAIIIPSNSRYAIRLLLNTPLYPLPICHLPSIFICIGIGLSAVGVSPT